MTQAKAGDQVKVGFLVKVSDGRVVAETEEGQGETLVIGSGSMFPALETQIVGMSVGEKKVASIASTEAFGPRNPELQFEIDRGNLPPGQEPAVGMQLQSRGEDGREIMFLIVEVGDAAVKVDGNHPLAGEDLTFEIELFELTAA